MGAFLRGRIVSARQQRPEGPILDESHAAARLMGELTRQDFPENGLQLDAMGNISLRLKQIADK